MSSNHNKRTRLFIIMFLITISSLGMVLCAFIRFIFYDDNREMMDNPFWFAFTIATISVFMFAMVILSTGRVAQILKH